MLFNQIKYQNGFQILSKYCCHYKQQDIELKNIYTENVRYPFGRLLQAAATLSHFLVSNTLQIKHVSSFSFPVANIPLFKICFFQDKVYLTQGLLNHLHNEQVNFRKWRIIFRQLKNAILIIAAPELGVQ